MLLDPSDLDYRLRTDRIAIELLDVDRQILELLVEGRCTRGYLSGETGEGPSWVSQRLSELVDEDVVNHVDHGLYELADDYIEVRVCE